MKGSYTKSLQIIFGAIVLGQIMLAIVFLNTTSSTYFSLKEELNPMHIILPIAALSAILTTQIFFKQSLKLLRKKETISSKLIGFRIVLLVKLALLELVAIIACIAFSVSGNLYFMLIFLTMLFYFLMQFPNKQKIINALELKDDEVHLID